MFAKLIVLVLLAIYYCQTNFAIIQPQRQTRLVKIIQAQSNQY